MTKEKCDYCNFESMNRATLVAYPENRQGFKFVYVGNDKKIHIDGNTSKEKTDREIKYCPMCGRKLTEEHKNENN